MENPTDAPRAKWLILWLIAATAAAPVSRRGFQQLGAGANPADDVFLTALAVLVTSAVLIGGPMVTSRTARGTFRDLYRARLPKRVMPLTILALPLTGMAAVAVYVLWAPLSLAFPDLTQRFLSETSRSMFAASGAGHALANGLCALSVVIIGPIAEECFFRGLLLRSWSREYGSARAVIASSIVFALFHVDLLGAFLFAIVMCALHAKYHSIWAPTIVHAAANGVAWGLEALHSSGVTPFGSAVEIPNAWWLALFGLLLALPWALRFRASYGPMSSWSFERAA